MTIQNNIQKTGNPQLIFQNNQPTNLSKLFGQLWIDDWGSIYQLDNLTGNFKILSGKGSIQSLVCAQSDFIGYNPLNSVTSGTGAAISILDDTAGHPGIYRLTPGATTTGSAGVITHSRILLGNGFRWFVEAQIRIPILSDDTNSFMVAFGFASTNPNIIAPNQVLFQYTHNNNSGNFVINTHENNNLFNNFDTLVNTIVNEWYTLSLDINSDASSVTGFINEINVGTFNVDLPKEVATNEQVHLGLWIQKRAGTTTRFVDIDSIELFGLNLNSNR